MSYFHCKIIDTIRVCIKVEETDPVTPIPEADFVTGDVVNPVIGHQKIFIFKYGGGLAVDGDTDGTIVGINDASLSLRGRILLNTDSAFIQELLENGSPSTTITTDAVTALFGQLPINAGLSIHIKISIHAVRTDASEKTAFWEYRYSFIRVAGTLVREKEILISQDRPGGMNAELIASSNNIELEVKGRVGETWKWTIADFKISMMEIS